jgi:hypothetical protein
MSDVKDFAVDRALRDTVTILKENPWGKGDIDTVCLVVALSIATTVDPKTYSKALKKLGFATSSEGMDWNDQSERTKERVIERIEQSISVDIWE